MPSSPKSTTAPSYWLGSSRSGKSTWRSSQAVAYQTGSLTDLSPCPRHCSLPEIRCVITQLSPSGRPSFSATWQTALRPGSLQIHADCCRCYQPLQRGWDSDCKRLCWSCKGFPVNLQVQHFDLAPGAASWPWLRVHGNCDQRNGKPQNLLPGNVIRSLWHALCAKLLFSLSCLWT